MVEAFTNLIGSSTVVLLALKMARRWIRAEVKWEMSAYSFDRYERGRDAAAQLLR